MGHAATPYLPPRTAGASLKQAGRVGAACDEALSSPANCGGLIEAVFVGHEFADDEAASSPANCGGLIEASCAPPPRSPTARSSPANCGGLIEAWLQCGGMMAPRLSSPANCGGLIEARARRCHGPPRRRIFPRELRGPH